MPALQILIIHMGARAHIIELRPTASQADYLRRCAGTMRFTYNHLVARWKAGEKYNRKVFQKHCVVLRQSTPWMNKVGSRATYEAMDGFHAAASNFFKSCQGKRSGKKMKPPTFKRKGCDDVVRFSHNTQFSLRDRNLRIQGLREEIWMREYIRLKGQVKSLSIKLHAGKWFATFVVDLAEESSVKPMPARKPSVGVDLGIKTLATLSSGEVVTNPKPLQKKLRLLRRRQRQVSRKFVRGKKQSNRYKIAKARVARLHKKVADQRKNAQHMFTSGLVKRFDRIVIEDLRVTNMLKNKRLTRVISDAGWASIRWQLEYKAKAAGVELIVADRFFASSKTCSCCGHKLETLKLSERTFNCPSCKASLDRDLNAALNLEKYQKSEPTPPIRGSRKTYVLDPCKSLPCGKAGSPEGVNINQQSMVSAETRESGHTAVIY